MTDTGPDAGDLRILLEALAIPDPWSRSFEGLDDCCQFCDCDTTRRPAGRTTWGHEIRCPWVEARVVLALGIPADHFVKDD